MISCLFKQPDSCPAAASQLERQPSRGFVGRSEEKQTGQTPNGPFPHRNLGKEDTLRATAPVGPRTVWPPLDGV